MKLLLYYFISLVLFGDTLFASEIFGIDAETITRWEVLIPAVILLLVAFVYRWRKAMRLKQRSVLQFIEEYSIVSDAYAFVSNKDLYSSYTEFCNSSGYHRFNQNNFSKELAKNGFELASKKIAGKARRGFKIEFGE